MASHTNTRGNVVTLKPRRRWLRRIGLTLVALVVAAVAGHWYWGERSEARLEERLLALRAAGEPVEPADLVSPHVPDADNAVVDLRAAADAIDDQGETWKAFFELEPALPLTDKELRVIRKSTDEFRQAFAAVRTASSKSRVDWGIQYESPIIQSVDLKDLSKQRRVATLLAAAALYAHQTGDDAEAVRLLREVLFISRVVDCQPTLVSHLVSIGMTAIASQKLAMIAPDLRIGDAGRDARPEQVKALLAELLDASGPIEGQQRAFRGERVALVDAARSMVEGRTGVNGLTGLPLPRGGRAQRAGGYLVKPMFLADAVLMADHMTAITAAAAAPDWAAFQARTPPSLDRTLESNRYLHVLASILLPSVNRAAYQNYRGMAERRMAAVAVAARWYAIDHDGKPPARLEDLVPRYLPSSPADPLAGAGRPLGYSAAGDRPVVYSVGENGKDDGGNEAPKTASRKDAIATSDLVVHLKRQPREVVPEEEPEAPAELPELPAAPQE